jgi:hypothetical protein
LSVPLSTIQISLTLAGLIVRPVGLALAASMAQLPSAAGVPLAQGRDARPALRAGCHLLEASDVDADRERRHVHLAAIESHRLASAIDLCVGDASFDAIEKVHHVTLDLKLDQIVAEQAPQHRVGHAWRQERENVGRRERNVPELMNEQRRPDRPQILGREREMVVLDPDHRATGASLRFVSHGMGKPEVDGAISLPEFRAILQMLDEHVAQRPQRAIGESVVVSVHVGIVEPDAAQCVAGVARWNLDPSGGIGHLGVGRAGAPRHPRPMRSPHRGIEGRDHSASRLPHLDALGVKLTKLDDEQADYLGVAPGGPYKAEQYRY